MHSTWHTYYAVAILIFIVVYVLTYNTDKLLLMGLIKSIAHVFEHYVFHSSLHILSKRCISTFIIKEYAEDHIMHAYSSA